MGDETRVEFDAVGKPRLAEASAPLPSEPTGEQCTARERVTITLGGQIVDGVACWYPQMGGYVGKCLIVPGGVRSDGSAGCFEAYVWHDGDFPFGGDWNDRRPPAHLHHCDPAQFVEFGEFVARLSGEDAADAEAP
jgi:hypothetical protein